MPVPASQVIRSLLFKICMLRWKRKPPVRRWWYIHGPRSLSSDRQSSLRVCVGLRQAPSCPSLPTYFSRPDSTQINTKAPALIARTRKYTVSLRVLEGSLRQSDRIRSAQCPSGVRPCHSFQFAIPYHLPLWVSLPTKSIVALSKSWRREDATVMWLALDCRTSACSVNRPGNQEWFTETKCER